MDILEKNRRLVDILAKKFIELLDPLIRDKVQVTPIGDRIWIKIDKIEFIRITPNTEITILLDIKNLDCKSYKIDGKWYVPYAGKTTRQLRKQYEKILENLGFSCDWKVVYTLKDTDKLFDHFIVTGDLDINDLDVAVELF